VSAKGSRSRPAEWHVPGRVLYFPGTSMSKLKSKRKRAIPEPRIEDHLPGKSERRSGRRNITLWLSESIIEACRPHPASKLRIWIEKTFPQDGR
jgi:hypothetical protein